MWKGFFSVPTWKEIPLTHRWMSTVHSETWWWEHKTHGYHFCCNIYFTNSKPLFHFYTWWNMRCSCVFFLCLESIHHFCGLIRDDSSHSNLLPRRKKSSEFSKPIAFFFPALFLQHNIKRSWSFYVFFLWLQAAFITVLLYLHKRTKGYFMMFHGYKWFSYVFITFLN